MVELLATLRLKVISGMYVNSLLVGTSTWTCVDYGGQMASMTVARKKIRYSSSPYVVNAS